MIHLLVALTAFASVAVAEILLSRRLDVSSWPSRIQAEIKTLAGWTAFTLLLLALSASKPRIGGLSERLFLASVLFSMMVIALQISIGTTVAQLAQ